MCFSNTVTFRAESKSFVGNELINKEVVMKFNRINIGRCQAAGWAGPGCTWAVGCTSCRMCQSTVKSTESSLIDPGVHWVFLEGLQGALELTWGAVFVLQWSWVSLRSPGSPLLDTRMFLWHSVEHLRVMRAFLCVSDYSGRTWVSSRTH